MSGQNAHMMPDGGCQITDSKDSSGDVVDSRRPQGDIAIEKSVGQGGANKPDDVFNIQYGLDQVPPIDGGPATPLKIDGVCGPTTIGAIRDFQKKHFGLAGSNGRIDPGTETLAKLNEKRQRWIQPYLPLSLGVDGWLLANMLRHAPFTRACVHAAMTKVSSAQISGLFGDSSMALINKHFRLSQGDDQAAALTKLYNVYNFMLSVLDRPQVYCTLDTGDEGERISSVAFARLGGFFDKSDLTGKIKFRRGAYFASEIQDFAAFVFIHEMRHYVEQQGDVGHHAKGWFSDPGMQALSTKQLLGNCDTYAGFALEAHNGEMQRPGWLRSTQFR